MDDFTKVLLHFDESATKDQCGNTWIAYNNPPISETNAKFGKALQLDGNGYLSLEGGITLGGQDFTIDGWFFLKSTSPAYSRIFDIFADKNTNGDRIALTKYNTANGMSLAINETYPGTSKSFTNQLNHFAVVYQHSAGKAILYMNGISELQLNVTLSAKHYSYLYIGKSNWDADGLTTGTVDEFRISDGIARWTSNFTPPTDPYDKSIEYEKQLNMRMKKAGTTLHEAVPLFVCPNSESYKAFYDKQADKTVYADVVPIDSPISSRFRIKIDGNTYSLMKFRTIVQTPTLTVNEFDYDANEHTPTLSSYDTDAITFEATGQTNAGDYKVKLTPKHGYKWPDASSDPIFLSWSIKKVSCNAHLSAYSVSVDNDNTTATVTVSYDGNGSLSAVSCDTSVATASVSGNTITITGKGLGTCAVIVKVAADDNHFASSELIINVEAEIFKPLNQCSPTEIQSIIRAGKADKAWKEGDCTSDITLTSTSFSDSTNSKKTTISGTYQAFILGFNHNNELEDEGKPSVHFALALKSNVPVAFCDGGYDKTYDASYHSNYGVYFIHKHAKTASNANGWSGSYIKSTILPKFFNALPSSWQAIIQPCTKWTDNKGAASGLESDVTATSDYLWLLSAVEVYGFTRTYGIEDNIAYEAFWANDYERDKQFQYPYFTNHSPIFYKHNATSTIAQAWLRSPYVGNGTSYLRIKKSGESEGNAGEIGSGKANLSRGIIPCFSVR